MISRIAKPGKFSVIHHISRALLFGCTTASVSLGALAAAQAHPIPANATADKDDTLVWSKVPSAPQTAPNVLLIMTDDVGFGASSSFGGPIPTPALDRLAKIGIKFNRFNTTALCSPTRASLLTGRNPHNVAMGNVTNFPTGYDGYTSFIPKTAGTVAEILKQGGYNTAMFGKAHITPESEMSAAGPFDRWPTGLGFEYFYGFLSADTSQWAPSLVENTRLVEPPHDDPSYHFDRDMADHTIRWLRDQHAAAPDKPFFVYYAPGTAHTPHHAPKAWLEKFRGKFDMGWDAMREDTFRKQKQMGIIPGNAELTPRPASLPAWSSLNADERLLASRLLEAFAASLSYADAQISRVLDELERSGQLENTLVIFIQGDNGGAAEGRLGGELWEQTGLYRFSDTTAYMLSRIDDIGGPKVYSHYPAAWGWAMSSPFQWHKQVASHFGGIRNGLVMAWPQHIKPGAVRSQFHHVNDIMPTILDATGVAAPDTLNGVQQLPIDGISMTYTFQDPNGPGRKTTQVFEMMENLGIYHDGWFAGTTPGRPPWQTDAAVAIPLNKRPWELYHIAKDYSQARDLAGSQPKKLEEMKALFWSEASRNNILPIHSSVQGSTGRPVAGLTHNPMIYTVPVANIPENAAPHLNARSFVIDADVSLPESGTSGVLVSHGGTYGGYAFYIHEGRLVFHYNGTGPRQYHIVSDRELPPGRHTLSADFDEDRNGPVGTGTLTLKMDGQAIGSGQLARGKPLWLSHTEGFSIAQDTITPVTSDYTIATSKFTGTLHTVTVTRK